MLKTVETRSSRMAWQRHLDDLERDKRDDFEYRFDAEKATWIIRFFSALRLTTGLPFPGKPFVPEPWPERDV